METVNTDQTVGAITACLRRQGAAAQEGDASILADSAEQGLALALSLSAQVAAGARPDAAALQGLRDLSTYNQLLLRYSFTSWAATCLDRTRLAQGYNARGQRAAQSGARNNSVRHDLGVI